MLSITGVIILPACHGSSGYLWKLMAKGEYPATPRIGNAQALALRLLGVLAMWMLLTQVYSGEGK
jgi:arginine:ornithine antiporter / lysine permease